MTRRCRIWAGTRINTIWRRAVDETFHLHRNSGITRRTGGIRRRTPQCRRRTPRGMRRDRNGIRGTREPEENECERQKNSLEFENRMNSKEVAKIFRNTLVSSPLEITMPTAARRRIRFINTLNRQMWGIFMKCHDKQSFPQIIHDLTSHENNQCS